MPPIFLVMNRFVLLSTYIDLAVINLNGPVINAMPALEFGLNRINILSNDLSCFTLIYFITNCYLDIFLYNIGIIVCRTLTIPKQFLKPQLLS